ncbi:MAG: hypothetical protein COT91_05120 [Candidatus Doudnabacteria bacterium CG10_big_fil_rev_8_21_14_0_10_41_10]|uniref:Glycoside hydrolase family 42 N-terminal domain-containing protein n=1 Tax=Candidatus Doudnabacteria bacterium CG10_big_fil_rev_8_21_14_0_10_41_10 TaxID=1974551 RepID=A0A2H0VCA7_9BACT|nr:MAG: hypothetical protein COT91_05120 [Candidatus Doudnabacteria bacterium CG10_big_fil_rev_8_21_14_0_10_41_10]
MIKKILLVIVFLIITLGAYFSIGSIKPAENIAWGISFSPRYAESLGLDWQETYLAILNDLKVTHLRLSSYWNDVEKVPAQRDYSELDFMIEEAQKRGQQIILSLGRRQPRWPECHIPEWAAGLELADQNVAVLNFVEETVERYKDVENITMWQVENEYYITWFGKCPTYEREFFDAELALVRSLDDRPILTTDSGELSTWIRASKSADVFGSTMYRKIHNAILGYFDYPIPPEYYKRHGDLVKLITGFDRQIVAELQMEPWAEKGLQNDSTETNFQSLSPEQFDKNFDYARRSGMDEIYMWGAEWWYYMRQTRGIPDFWDKAKLIWEKP